MSQMNKYSIIKAIIPDFLHKKARLLNLAFFIHHQLNWKCKLALPVGAAAIAARFGIAKLANLLCQNYFYPICMAFY